MLSRPVEAAPKKAAKSTQQVVSDYSATLTGVFRASPQLEGKCHGIIRKGHSPPTPIMEAFSKKFPPPQRPSAKAIPTLLGSTPSQPSNHGSFRKGKVN
jgi:hypothetical protein